MYLTKQSVEANQPIKLNILKPNYQKIISFAKNATIGVLSLFASIVLIKVLFTIINFKQIYLLLFKDECVIIN
jgi:hypothetical protein